MVADIPQKVRAVTWLVKLSHLDKVKQSLVYVFGDPKPWENFFYSIYSIADAKS